MEGFIPGVPVGMDSPPQVCDDVCGPGMARILLSILGFSHDVEALGRGSFSQESSKEEVVPSNL
jgi:hypothetical protein